MPDPAAHVLRGQVAVSRLGQAAVSQRGRAVVYQQAPVAASQTAQILGGAFLLNQVPSRNA